jgi:CP family cyanate transporter-like MFS transporter
MAKENKKIRKPKTPKSSTKKSTKHTELPIATESDLNQVAQEAGFPEAQAIVVTAEPFEVVAKPVEALIGLPEGKTVHLDADSLLGVLPVQTNTSETIRFQELQPTLVEQTQEPVLALEAQESQQAPLAMVTEAAPAPTEVDGPIEAQPESVATTEISAASGMKAAWVVIAAGIVTAMHVGKMSAALPLIQEQLQFSLVESGLLLSFIQLAGMCLGLFMGISAQSIGLRRCMVLGLGILAGSSFVSTWLTHFESMLFFRAIEGIGLLMVALSAPNLIRQLVPAHRRSGMLGIWGSYMSFGMALALLMSPSILGFEHWQFMWNFFAALSVVALVAVWKTVPAELKLRNRNESGDWVGRLRQTVSTPQTWFLGITFTAYSAPWVAVMGFLPSIYVEGHLSMQQASALTAWVVGMSILGNVSAGYLLQKGMNSSKLIQFGFVGVAIGGWMAFGLADEAPWFVSYAGALLFSLFSGFVPATLFAQSVRVAPNENCISTTVGMMQQFNAFGQFIGPSLVAYMASSYGGWQMTWVGILSFACLGILTSMAMHDRMKKTEEKQRNLFAEEEAPDLESQELQAT